MQTHQTIPASRAALLGGVARDSPEARPREAREPNPEPSSSGVKGVRSTAASDRDLAAERDAQATRLMACYRDSRSPADFELLYAHACRDVYTWILSLLRQGPAHLDSMELLQDTFVNVYRYPSAFRDESPSSFRVWVRTIAGNLVRRARSRPMRAGLTELPEGGLEPADLRACGPDQQADLSESAVRLGRAWDLFLYAYLEGWKQLAERDRRALLLVEVEELSYTAAAAELGVRAPNMKMIVFRSRKRLAAHMRRVLGGARRLAA